MMKVKQIKPYSRCRFSLPLEWSVFIYIQQQDEMSQYGENNTAEKLALRLCHLLLLM